MAVVVCQLMSLFSALTFTHQRCGEYVRPDVFTPHGSGSLRAGRQELSA